MNYEKDLFISYSHLDNQPLPAEQQGWVSRFHKTLENFLSVRMGHRAAIWRDEKLSGNDVFAQEIVAQFPKVAVLVSILSPSYVTSEWCRKEVEEFCRAAGQGGEVIVGNKSRIIKVVKSPPNKQDPLPPLMQEIIQDTLGYEFYEKRGDKPVELDAASSAEAELRQQYMLKIQMLAWDIAQTIEKLDEVKETAPEIVSSKTPVYLAQCSHDRRDSRDALLAELKLHGCPVLPDKPLHFDAEETFTKEVSEMLDRCGLSVHLIGSTYGMVPDGPSQKSVVVLENDLAVRQSKRRGLRRLIWLPEGTQPTGVEQQQFVDALMKNSDAQFGADLITTNLETLKGAIYSTLQQLEAPDRHPEIGLGLRAPKVVYLIYAKADREATRPLRRWLMEKGYEVQTPVFEGDATTVRQANQDSLAQCDAVILFYGGGDEAWKHMVVNDVKKASSYRGDKPAIVSFTYIAAPATDDKADLIALSAPDLLNGVEGFSEERLKPVVESLQKA